MKRARGAAVGVVRVMVVCGLIGVATPRMVLGQLSGADMASAVGDGTSARASMLCTLAPRANDGLSAAQVSNALGPLTGGGRWTAVRCLVPKIQQDLSGNDLVTIVGDGVPYRENMLCDLRDHVRQGISATETATALGTLVGGSRWRAVQCLQPRIQEALTGEDFSKIAGAGLAYRSNMMCDLKANARQGLSAAEVAVALGPLIDGPRWQAVRCLAPRVQNNMNGLDFAQVLGDSKSYRANIICDLKAHRAPSLNGAQLELALSGLSGTQRSAALNCLETAVQLLGSAPASGSMPTNSAGLPAGPRVIGVTPRSVEGADCKRTFDLVGAGFSKEMVVRAGWLKPQPGQKDLRSDQVEVLDASNARITINTEEDSNTWLVRVGRTAASLSAPISFAVTARTTKSFNDPIGELAGVVARSNGACTASCYDTWEEDAPNQCVAYVHRYYQSQFPSVSDAAPPWDHARAFWERKTYKDLTKYINGAAHRLPTVGDMVFFDAGAYGHVALVRGVAANRIQVVQQNLDRNTAYASLPYSIEASTGVVTIGSTMTIEGSGCIKTLPVQGWLSPAE